MAKDVPHPTNGKAMSAWCVELVRRQRRPGWEAIGGGEKTTPGSAFPGAANPLTGRRRTELQRRGGIQVGTLALSNLHTFGNAGTRGKMPGWRQWSVSGMVIRFINADLGFKTSAHFAPRLHVVRPSETSMTESHGNLLPGLQTHS